MVHQPGPDPHVEKLLEDALEATFPASDPIAWPLVEDRPTEAPAAIEGEAPPSTSRRTGRARRPLRS